MHVRDLHKRRVKIQTLTCGIPSHRKRLFGRGGVELGLVTRMRLGKVHPVGNPKPTGASEWMPLWEKQMRRCDCADVETLQTAPEAMLKLSPTFQKSAEDALMVLA